MRHTSPIRASCILCYRSRAVTTNPCALATGTLRFVKPSQASGHEQWLTLTALTALQKGFLLTGGEDARVCVWSSPDNTLWTPAMLSDGADRTKAPIIPRFKPY